MADEPYRVLPAWPDMMVYSEGDERTLRFSCSSMDEPPVVDVPSEARWREQMPAWAHERRATIVARLRRAQCVVCEVDGQRSRACSLDSSLCLETTSVRDERSALWETARVLDAGRNEPLASIESHGSPCVVRFPAPRRIALTFHDARRRPRTLTIDAELNAFSLDSAQPMRPLAELSGALASEPAAQDAPSYAPVPSEKKQATSWLFVIGGAVLTCIGVWQLSCGVTLKDRLLGALCAALFATTTWLSWQERRG